MQPLVMWQTSSLGRTGSWILSPALENWGQAVLPCSTWEGIFCGLGFRESNESPAFISLQTGSETLL